MDEGAGLKRKRERVRIVTRRESVPLCSERIGRRLCRRTCAFVEGDEDTFGHYADRCWQHERAETARVLAAARARFAVASEAATREGSGLGGILARLYDHREIEQLTNLPVNPVLARMH